MKKIRNKTKLLFSFLSRIQHINSFFVIIFFNYFIIPSYYTMSNNKRKEKNRDINQQNKAATLVEACLLSIVAKDALVTIEKIVKSISHNDNSSCLSSKIEETSKLITITKEASTKANKLYCSCSTHIKCGSNIIAHNETQTIKRGIKHNETRMLQSKLRHYYPTVISMHQSIYAISNSNSITQQQTEPTTTTCMCNHTSNQQCMCNHTCMDVIPCTIPPTNITQSTVQTPCSIPYISTFQARFFSNRSYFILPPPFIGTTLYSPKAAIHVLTNCCDKSNRLLLDLPKKNGKYQTARLSQYRIIVLMIVKKYIPINKTQMYTLVSTAKRDRSLIPDWWADISKNGQKPHLKPPISKSPKICAYTNDFFYEKPKS